MAYKVMVVDDAAMMRLYISSFLNARKDFKLVAQAANGQEALDKLPDLPDLDLILLDIEMPVMDGRETLAELARRGGRIGNTPVIMLTANAAPETITDFSGFPRAHFRDPCRAPDGHRPTGRQTACRASGLYRSTRPDARFRRPMP